MRNPGFAAALLCVALAAAVAKGGEQTIAARVNGTAISEDTVRDVVKSVIAGEPVPPSGEEIDRLTEAALDSLIDLELLYQEAERRKIQVGNEQIEDEIRHTRARFADEAQFDAALRHSGMSKSQLRAETRKTLLADRLLETVVWKEIDVTPDQIRHFYDENAKEFAHPAQVRVRDLFVRAPESPATARSAAERKAEDLRARIAASHDFAGVARKSSDDRRSADQGGDLGYLETGALPGAVEKKVSDLPVGKLSDVIESDDGFYVVEVTARRPPGVTPFEDVEEAIRKTLLEEERERRRQAFVTKLREGAKIEIPTLAKPTPQGSPAPAPAGA